MQVAPYIYFDGQCEQAFDFYAEALRGTILMSMTYADSPVPTPAPDDAKHRIMHICLALGDMQIMGSDMPPGMMAQPMNGFSIHLGPAEPAEAERIYNALLEGGTVRMPLQETFWAKKFGMLVDKFGTPWIVNCAVPLG